MTAYACSEGSSWKNIKQLQKLQDTIPYIYQCKGKFTGKDNATAYVVS